MILSDNDNSIFVRQNCDNCVDATRISEESLCLGSMVMIPYEKCKMT